MAMIGNQIPTTDASELRQVHWAGKHVTRGR